MIGLYKTYQRAGDRLFQDAAWSALTGSADQYENNCMISTQRKNASQGVTGCWVASTNSLRRVHYSAVILANSPDAQL